jgi:hypothetical protein
MNMLLISGCERAVSIHSEDMKRGYWMRGYVARTCSEHMKRGYEERI